VGGDAGKPGGEPGFFAEAGEVFQRADEGLLGDILRVVRVLKDAQNKSVNSTFVPSDECLKGVEIARLGTADKVGVVCLEWRRC
jgi:hypothetical protein